MAASAKAAPLAKLKLAIGALTRGKELDDYYTEKLDTAQAIIAANDISDSILATELGMSAIVLQAQVLMGNVDADEGNRTIILMRNTLSAQTKGERYGEGDDDADGA